MTLSAATSAHIEKQVDDLAEEFVGIVSRETVARLVGESVDGLSAARFDTFSRSSCIASAVSD